MSSLYGVALTTLGQRLKSERERLGMSQTAFADLGGVGKSTQINYEKGGRAPDADYLTALEKAGVDIYFVLTGRHFGSTSSEALSADRIVSSADYSAIPIYDIEAAAGVGRLFDDELVETTIQFNTEQLQRDGLDPSQVVGVRVRGDSMGETLHDGDRVLVDRSSRTPDGVFLLRMDDGLRIKRVQRVAGGGWMLISDNARYQPELVDPLSNQNVEIIGECVMRLGRIS